MNGRQDTGGHGSTETKGVANGNHPVTNPGRRTVSEFDERKGLVGLDLEHRNIRCRIAADKFRLIFGAVRHDHSDRFDGCVAVARCHHMVVGDDIAIGRDDESRSQRLCFTGLFPATAALAIAEQAIKRGAGERIVIADADALGGRYVDDGWL